MLENVMRQDKIIELFSNARVSGYVDLVEHEANLALIGEISHKIGILEIILRNKIDSIMRLHNPLWLKSLPNDLQIELPKVPNFTRDKIISTQSLGFWVRVVEHYKIHNRVFCAEFLDSLDLRKYYMKNPRYFYSTSIMHYHKVSAILQLFRLIRNRAFHFENLYKFTDSGYPRLNVKITNKYKQSVYIAVEPSKIVCFLNDLIASFDKDLIYYAERK